MNFSNLPAASSNERRWPWAHEGSRKERSIDLAVQWPKITVVTPSYNQAQFLEQTIRSVLLQDYPNLEYIVLDGGSSDGSIDIIRKYSDFLTHWESQPDGGQSQAINKGLRIATGELLAWINSDDYLAPNALATVGQLFSERPEVQWAIGHALLFDNDELPFATRHSHALSDDEFMQWDKNWFAQQATFWRKSLLEVTGDLDESLHYLMDWELWLRFNAVTPPAIISQTLASYRYHAAAKCVTDSESHSRNLFREELQIHGRILSEQAGKLERYRSLSLKRLLWLTEQLIADSQTQVLKTHSGWELISELGSRVARRFKFLPL